MLKISTLTPFRRQLLDLTPPAHGHLASNPSTAFVWPTEKCSIGCAHCNFASLPIRRGEKNDVTIAPDHLMDWLTEAGARSVVLCGGGEPLDEPEFCAELIRLCGRTGVNCGIYTSGSSLKNPSSPSEYIGQWKSLLGENYTGQFRLRLSLDAFHADRLGTAVLAEWIAKTEVLTPDWRVTLRSLRVKGDDSLQELADSLGATVRERGKTSARLELPSGTSVVVERMAYVVDGRGTLDLLDRRGLGLPPDDAEAVAPWQTLVGRSGRLGRPLSRRLTVGRNIVDLEIHSDATVHVLEAQPFDARLSLAHYRWAQMRDLYYRDPLIHVVSFGGLGMAAELLRQAIQRGVAPRSSVPFSIEAITDARVLDWVTAAAALHLAPVFAYPEACLTLARDVCGDSPQVHEGS